MEKKKPWEKPGSFGGPVLNEHGVIMIQAASQVRIQTGIGEKN